MKKHKNSTLKQYTDSLSKKTPTPGGGSAAALAASLGAALISMVANYSLGKGKAKGAEKKIKNTLQKSEKIRKRLLDLVDLDAKAYLKVVAARKESLAQKKKALKEARAVPLEVCRLCYSAVQLTPLLVKEGNKNLVSDIQVALDLLSAAFQSALTNVKINQ